MSSSYTTTITQENDVTVVVLGSEFENLEEGDLDDLQEMLLNVASSADPQLVVLDLQQTKFFGSAFIELLFRAWNRVHNRSGGQFAISGLTAYCREVIEVTHLDRLWDVCGTSEEAVRLLSSRSN